MALEDALIAYRQQLEAVRAAFASDWADDDERDMALEDLGKARDWVEVEWLEKQLAVGGSVDSGPTGTAAPFRPFDPDVGLTTDQPDGW